MATHTITIYATNANPLPLTISDDEGHSASTHDDDANLTTEFKVGDTVRFEISTATGCEIANIESINVNDLIDENGNHYNLFTSGPQSAEDGTGSWVGVMGLAGVGSSDHYTSPAESYTITFLMNDGTSHTEDPRLKIKQ
jgi:hypothetical protein